MLTSGLWELVYMVYALSYVTVDKTVDTTRRSSFRGLVRMTPPGSTGRKSWMSSLPVRTLPGFERVLLGLADKDSPTFPMRCRIIMRP
jgi:hypothetical protein